MADLVAQGAESSHRWRHTLPSQTPVLLGRASTDWPDWQIDWDRQISRVHAELTWDGSQLRVRRMPEATNPVFYQGQAVDEFLVSPGEHFVLGQTTFSLVSGPVRMTLDLPSPDAERNYTADNLRKLEYQDAGQRIAVLAQLPDVISRSVSEADLHIKLVNLLLAGIRRANTVAILRLEHSAESDDPAEPSGLQVVHWDQRLVSETGFQPSGSLIRSAIGSGETVLHLWKTGGVFGDDRGTVLNDGDWAFATPLPGEAGDGLVIYVAGNYASPLDSHPDSDPLDLRDDIKFAELVATSLSNLRHVRRLEGNQASLRSFFSPVVLEAIARASADEVLAPRECEVSVLFCDLRGFSLKSEQASDDLLELLDRVSGALGVTTRNILDQRGVVGDFHGDAAMGFWGWPLDQPDRALRACRTACEIQSQFAGFSREPDHPLHDFRIGLGIATGTAVAGRIGTDDQVKVTVFGPVVNLASRLESMTRQLRCETLIDPRTDELIRNELANRGNLPLRVRRLAVVRPAGMENPIQVSQVLPVAGSGCCLSDADIANYEQALDRFTAGHWAEAFDRLHQVPADDTAKDFLTVYIAQHNRTAPDDWPGYIVLQQK